MAKEVCKEKNLCEAPRQNNHAKVEQRLLEGNQRYMSRTLECFFKEDRVIDSGDQKPYAAVVSCADSRVIPEKIFDAGPGELFVTRVAGNIATDDIIASLDYAVEALGTRFVIVMGHQNCGAVKSAIKFQKRVPKNGVVISPDVSRLLQQIIPAVLRVDQTSKGKSAKPEHLKKVIVENAKLSGFHLRHQSKHLRKSNRVHIYYAYFDLDTGKVDLYKLKTAKDYE